MSIRRLRQPIRFRSWQRRYLGFPHSGQEFGAAQDGLAHSLQNLVSAEEFRPQAGAAPPAGADVDFFTASIIACPMATPAS